jgi:hypothetical protein
VGTEWKGEMMLKISKIKCIFAKVARNAVGDAMYWSLIIYSI